MIAIDMMCAVCETYYLTPMECLTNLDSFGEMTGKRFLVLSLVFLLTFLVVGVAAFFPIATVRRVYRGPTAAALLVFVFLCVAVDGVGIVRRVGFLPNPLRPAIRDATKLSYYTQLRLSRRTLVRLAFLISFDQSFARRSAQSKASIVSLPGASAVAFRQLNLAALSGPEKPNVVFVLLESWGLSNDPSLESTLVSPYSQPEVLARYRVSTGTVAFKGPTLGGEGRELCGTDIGFRLMAAKKSDPKSCLPDWLAAQGYHNVALHGLDGRFFERMDWYPRIGFNEMFFRDQFKQQGLSECFGAFTGICDADIARWIGNRLSKPQSQPQFVYWVTLNSHLPVPVPSPLQNGAPCLLPPLTKDVTLCSWYQLVANVHSSTARLAMTALSRPTVFIIVGDHAPPFGDPALRSAFSSTVVPYILLMPRVDAQIAATHAGAPIN